MSLSLASLFSVPRPAIGMLHAPPLPGSPAFAGNFEAVKAAVLDDARVLAEAGFHGLLLENFGDAPFFPGRAPAVTVAAMTAMAVEIRRRFDLPLGINVLRNDGQSALAICSAAGGRFIRVNVLCGARVTDQGVIQGIAHDLLRERAAVGPAIQILADVDVKHSAPLAPRPIEEEAEEALQRGGADGLIVSGAGSGRSTDPGKLLAVRMAARGAPVFVGSGVTPESVAEYSAADAFIVGTAIKRGGITANRVDPSLACAFIAAHGRLMDFDEQNRRSL